MCTGSLGELNPIVTGIKIPTLTRAQVGIQTEKEEVSRS